MPPETKPPRPPFLRFRPLMKRTIWGGRRLGTQLGKPIGSESDYAESWEIVDHGEDQSVVAEGPWEGLPLAELIRREPQWLLGPAAAGVAGNGLAEGQAGGQPAAGNRFPLLLKYLDCNRVLSVQVHPDDAYARTLSPPDLGKTEAWYIVSAEPDSLVYAGLKPAVDRESLAEAIREGRTEETLHSFHPQPGDCLYIPAGTVHALGSGLVVAEIQQSSDTTFRLFDWNRVDTEGRSRPLHIEQALDVTDYASGPVSPRQVDSEASGWQTLVACDKFVLRSLRQGADQPIAGDGRFHLLTVPHGEAVIEGWEEPVRLGVGDSGLIAAGAGAARMELSPGSTVLEMHLP